MLMKIRKVTKVKITQIKKKRKKKKKKRGKKRTDMLVLKKNFLLMK